MDISDFLTTQEAAQILGVSTEHVQKLCRDGKLQCRRLGEGRRSTYIIEPESVDEYAVQEHKRGWKKGRTRKKNAAPK